MLQLRNETPFAGTLLLLPDQRGVDTLYAVLRGTFLLEEVGGTVAQATVAEEQQPVVLGDEFLGDPAESSLRRASDVALHKPGTDVTLTGSAWAPEGRAAEYVDTGVSVGPVRKAVRVFGNRVWTSTGVGLAPSSPEPFVRMPLVWERAFGGLERRGEELDAEARNPVGVGFRGRLAEGSAKGTPLPNLEDPWHPVRSPRDRPTPAAFAPVAAHWQPRVGFAGTYDDAWQRERAPYLPRDFDGRYFQHAPPDLVVEGHLAGGEVVELLGVTPGGRLTFRLPAPELTVAYHLDGGPRAGRPLLDTVALEPDEGRVGLVWRIGLPCDKTALRIREVVATVAPGGADG